MEPSPSLKQKAEEAISSGLRGFRYGNLRYAIASTLPKDHVSMFFVLGEHVVYAINEQGFAAWLSRGEYSDGQEH